METFLINMLHNNIAVVLKSEMTAIGKIIVRGRKKSDSETNLIGRVYSV